MSLEQAYIELLKLPYGDLFRSGNQDIYARIRDAIAFKIGQDPEDVQESFEEAARAKFFEALGLNNRQGVDK